MLRRPSEIGDSDDLTSERTADDAHRTPDVLDGAGPSSYVPTISNDPISMPSPSVERHTDTLGPAVPTVPNGGDSSNISFPLSTSDVAPSSPPRWNTWPPPFPSTTATPLFRDQLFSTEQQALDRNYAQAMFAAFDNSTFGQASQLQALSSRMSQLEGLRTQLTDTMENYDRARAETAEFERGMISQDFGGGGRPSVGQMSRTGTDAVARAYERLRAREAASRPAIASGATSLTQVGPSTPRQVPQTSTSAPPESSRPNLAAVAAARDEQARILHGVMDLRARLDELRDASNSLRSSTARMTSSMSPTEALGSPSMPTLEEDSMTTRGRRVLARRTLESNATTPAAGSRPSNMDTNTTDLDGMLSVIDSSLAIIRRSSVRLASGLSPTAPPGRAVSYPSLEPIRPGNSTPQPSLQGLEGRQPALAARSDAGFARTRQPYPPAASQQILTELPPPSPSPAPPSTVVTIRHERAPDASGISIHRRPSRLGAEEGPTSRSAFLPSLVYSPPETSSELPPPSTSQGHVARRERYTPGVSPLPRRANPIRGPPIDPVLAPTIRRRLDSEGRALPLPRYAPPAIVRISSPSASSPDTPGNTGATTGAGTPGVVVSSSAWVLDDAQSPSQPVYPTFVATPDGSAAAPRSFPHPRVAARRRRVREDPNGDEIISDDENDLLARQQDRRQRSRLTSRSTTNLHDPPDYLSYLSRTAGDITTTESNTENEGDEQDNKLLADESESAAAGISPVIDPGLSITFGRNGSARLNFSAEPFIPNPLPMRLTDMTDHATARGVSERRSLVNVPVALHGSVARARAAAHAKGSRRLARKVPDPIGR